MPWDFLLFLVGYIGIHCLILYPQNSGLFQLSMQLDSGGLPYMQGREEKEGRLTVGGAGRIKRKSAIKPDLLPDLGCGPGPGLSTLHVSFQSAQRP